MAPPNRAEQIAESDARKAAGVDPAEHIAAMDVVEDGPRGDPQGGPPVVQGGDKSQQRPPTPNKGSRDQRRDEIVARFRTGRTQEAEADRDDVAAFTRSGLPLDFEQFQEQPEVAAEAADTGEVEQPEPEAPPALPPRVKLKVHGVEQEYALEDVIAQAQIALASDNILEKAKSRLQEVDTLLKDTRARVARPDQPGHHAEQNRTQPADASTPSADDDGSQTSEDPINKLIEAMQFGEPSEARPLLEQTIRQEAKKIVGQELEVRDLKNEGARSAKVLKDFKDGHPEIAKDPYAQAVMQTRIFEMQVEDLKSIGIEPEMIQTPDGNVTAGVISQAHAWYRSKGYTLRTPSTMLETARDDYFKWKSPGQQASGQPVDPAAPKAPPRIEVRVDRDARRTAIQQSPTRTSPASPSAPARQPAARTDPSSVVQGMQAKRSLARGRIGVG